MVFEDVLEYLPTGEIPTAISNWRHRYSFAER